MPTRVRMGRYNKEQSAYSSAAAYVYYWTCESDPPTPSSPLHNFHIKIYCPVFKGAIRHEDFAALVQFCAKIIL